MSNGRFRRLDFCLRLSCATTIRHDFTTDCVVKINTRHSYDTCGCHKCKFPRVDGRKSWRMLVAHDSRKQKSYRQNLAYSLFKTTSLVTQHGCPQNPRKVAVIYCYFSISFGFCLWCILLLNFILTYCLKEIKIKARGILRFRILVIKH